MDAKVAEVNKVANELYAKLKQWVEQGGYMAGLCSDVSELLALQLEALGHKCTIPQGAYLGEYHHWVECYGRVYDLTVEQFGTKCAHLGNPVGSAWYRKHYEVWNYSHISTMPQLREWFREIESEYPNITQILK